MRDARRSILENRSDQQIGLNSRTRVILGGLTSKRRRGICAPRRKDAKENSARARFSDNVECSNDESGAPKITRRVRYRRRDRGTYRRCFNTRPTQTLDRPTDNTRVISRVIRAVNGDRIAARRCSRSAERDSTRA